MWTDGGPNFAEASPASQQLHLEEYFYADTSADLATDNEGNYLPQELPFDKAALGARAKWARHVDVRRVTPQLVTLTPACGIGSYRDADGLGAVVGFAARGGGFVNDGLVTSVDRWLRSHYIRKRRFRFVGAQPVDADGDVRAFVLAPSLAQNRSAAPHVAMASCTAELSCPANSGALVCSCVSICVSGALHWAVVVGGSLRVLSAVGTCASGSLWEAEAGRVEQVRLAAGLSPFFVAASPSQSCGACPWHCQAYNPRTRMCSGAATNSCPRLPQAPPWCTPTSD